MKLRSTAIAATLLASVLSGTAITVTPAVADSSKTCNISTMTTKIKGQVPVIVVHGLMGNADAWGSTSDPNSMVSALKKIKGVYLDEPFDYSSTNTKWVTDDNIGPRLARRIDCLAQASGRDPVVLGHSMGGATARQAASLKVNGRNVADEFGMLITLGTPNLGSSWANVGTDFIHSLCPAPTVMDNSLCDFGQISALKGLRENSAEIKNLPWMPRNVPVLALAGDVSIHVNIFNASITTDTESDLVVSKESALQDIRTTSAGGGSKTFACTMEVGLHLPDCWHSALTSNRDVIKTAVDAVTRYAKATTPKPVNPLDGFGGVKWYRHGSGFTINKSGVASMSITSGAGELEGCGYWCTFTATLQLTAQNDGSLKGIYAKVWFEAAGSYEDSTTRPVPTPPADITDAYPKEGDATKLTLEPDNQLHVSGLGDPGSYWCGPKSKDIKHVC